jgi:hypothetical protein
LLRQALLIRDDRRDPVLTILRVTLDLARHLLLTMPVLTLQRVTLDLARDLLLTMPVLTIQRVTLDLARHNTL